MHDIDHVTQAKYWDVVLPRLARLLVELDHAGLTDSSPGLLGAPMEWLSGVGLPNLLNAPQSPGGWISSLEIVASIHRALLISDESEQLDGQAALDFLGGWILSRDPDFQDTDAVGALCRGAYCPTYRPEFISGWKRQREEALAAMCASTRRKLKSFQQS